MTEDLFAKLNALREEGKTNKDLWNLLGAFQSKNLKDYSNKIREVLLYKQSVLYKLKDDVIFIKDIKRYEVMDAITALSLFPNEPLGERIVIEGSGLKNRNLEFVDDIFHLVVTKNHQPQMIISSDYKTLLEIYRITY